MRFFVAFLLVIFCKYQQLLIYIPSFPAKIVGVCFAIFYGVLAYRILKDDKKV